VETYKKHLKRTFIVVLIGSVILAAGMQIYYRFSRPAVLNTFPGQSWMRKEILGQVKSINLVSGSQSASFFVITPLQSQAFGYNSEDRTVRLGEETIIQKYLGTQGKEKGSAEVIFEKVDTVVLKVGDIVSVVSESDIYNARDFSVVRVEILPPF